MMLALICDGWPSRADVAAIEAEFGDGMLATRGKTALGEAIERTGSLVREGRGWRLYEVDSGAVRAMLSGLSPVLRLHAETALAG